MASPNVVELTLYSKAGQAYAFTSAFRNIYVCEKQHGPTATSTAEEKARRVQRISDDVQRMLSDELKLPRSLSHNQRTGIKKTFEIVLNPDSHLPDNIRNPLLALKQKWDGEKWGKETNDEDDSLDDLGADSAVTFQIPLPPKDHPIYGERGIMHGVLFVRGNKGQVVYKLNPRVKHRSAMVFGHNGIDVGSWWPLQIAALHSGAHGARIAGIAGNSREGAYSIVVAATYNDLDKDEGDILYYSGSNSHDNKDPLNTPHATNSTKALAMSLANGRDIRVLRSVGSSAFAPRAGVRYDGLYRVVEKCLGTNPKGGLYERYKLERKPGQTPWGLLDLVPSLEQRAELGKIQDGY